MDATVTPLLSLDTLQEAGERTQEPGERTQEPGERTQEPGERTQEPGVNQRSDQKFLSKVADVMFKYLYLNIFGSFPPI